MTVKHLTLVVFVDQDAACVLTTLEDIVEPYRSRDHEIEIRARTGLDDPFALCWEHKKLFASEFFPGRYSHFIYLEDDMRFGQTNLFYFLGARSVLQRHGLIPSFVRWEWNRRENSAYATDQLDIIHEIHVPVLTAGDHLFLPMPSVYCACFVMDRALAREYVASRSFDREESRLVFDWGISERAAMGLAFENPPPTFYTRYRVPFDRRLRSPASCCWVQHWPANFTNDPDTILGSRRMSRMLELRDGS